MNSATFFAIISLSLTASLVASGQVAQTLPITGATTTTPIAVTSPAHGVPLGRVVHGVVSGVTGETEANGVFVLTPTDPNTFQLSTFTAQGLPLPSVGVHPYTGGGVISVAFPDYGILYGRRNVALSSSVASPRIVVVPTDGRKWSFESYGGDGPSPPQERGTAEQQAQKQYPQVATRYPTFRVLVTGAATPPSPDFGDFILTEGLAEAFYAACFAFTGPRAAILHEAWPSQTVTAGSQTQRGQQMELILELQESVTYGPLEFVPVGTSLVLDVVPLNGGSGDTTVITLV